MTTSVTGTPSTGAAATDAARPARRGRALLLLAFAQMIIAIDYNIVFVALPSLGSALHFDAQTLQWVVSAYAVAFGGFLLLGGRAADLFGRRRMFVSGLGVYAASSLLGALAINSGMLVAARIGQGLGGALLAPATLSLIAVTFAEGAERNRALAVWGGAGGSGMVLGSIFGGLLTEAFGWSSVFYLNVPLAVFGMIAALRWLAPDERRTDGYGFDLGGALSGTVGATSFVFALVQGPREGWGSSLVVGAIVLAVVLLGGFIVIELRSIAPMMPLALLRNRMLSTGTAIAFLFMATFGALAYFLTEYFQDVRGYSALTTGFAFLLPCACVLIGTVIGGKLVTHVGVAGTLAGSLAVGTVGTVLFTALLGSDTNYAVLMPGLVLLSVAQGVVFTAMFATATTGVDAADQGIASGIATTGQQVGGAVGLAVLIAIANSGLHTATSTGSVQTDGIKTALWFIAGGVALTGLLTVLVRRPRTTSEPVAATTVPAPVLPDLTVPVGTDPADSRA